MSDILTVKDFTILSALPNHEQGEVAFCEDTKDYYVYNDGWQKMNMKMNSDGVQMSLYDFNRQIVEQLPAFGDTQWIGAESIFSDWDAKDKATEMAEKLSEYFDVKIINIPKEGDDPNNYLQKYGRKAMWKLIEDAEDYGEFSSITRLFT